MFVKIHILSEQCLEKRPNCDHNYLNLRIKIAPVKAGSHATVYTVVYIWPLWTYIGHRNQTYTLYTGIASALTVTDSVFMQRFRLSWPLFPLWRKEQSILRIYITNFPLSYTYCKMKLYLQEGYEPTVTIRFTA